MDRADCCISFSILPSLTPLAPLCVACLDQVLPSDHAPHACNAYRPEDNLDANSVMNQIDKFNHFFTR